MIGSCGAVLAGDLSPHAASKPADEISAFNPAKEVGNLSDGKCLTRAEIREINYRLFLSEIPCASFCVMFLMFLVRINSNRKQQLWIQT